MTVGTAGKVTKLREEVTGVRSSVEVQDGDSTNLVQDLQHGLQAARDIVAEQVLALDLLLDQAVILKDQLEERDAQLEVLRAADTKLKSDHMKLEEIYSKLQQDNEDLNKRLNDAIRMPEHPELARRSKTVPLPRGAEKTEEDFKQETHHDDSLALPVKLRGFSTLMEMNNARQLSRAPELANAERALQIEPDSAEAVDKLKVSLSVLSQCLQQNIDAKLREANIKSSCIEVVEAGNAEFLEIYNSVWRLIKNNEQQGLEEYKSAVNKAVCSGEAVKQRTNDVVELYRDAAKTKLRHDPLIKSLLGADSIGFHADVSLPQDLKKTARVLEKSQLRADAPGNPDKIADIVRAMVITTRMQDVAKIVLKLSQCSDIVLVRVKERFESAPTTGGWRDCSMNYYLTGDPAKHICEVQVAHQTMLTARKGLPGHVIYNRVRNASEILEALENCQAFGLSIADARRAGLSVSDCRAARFSTAQCKSAGWTATDCRQAGFSASECQQAGYTAYDFKKAGFTLADCKHVGFELRSCSYADYPFDGCKEVGFSAADCKQAGAKADECRQLGYTAAECRDAGFYAIQCRNGGFSEEDLFKAGFSLRDCIEQGALLARASRNAGFSASDCKDAGMTVAECAAAGFSLADIYAAGFPVNACKKAGYSLPACLRAGYPVAACKDAGFAAEDFLQQGMTASAFKDPGFSAADCRSAGFSASECKSAGYTAAECQAGGFSLVECKNAGFSVADFKSAGLSAAHCKEAGYTALDCRNADFLASEMRAAGFSALQCLAVGFSRRVCLAAGFTEADCDEAEEV